MTWVLILFIHVGPLADGNSVTLTNVPGFSSQQECDAAGRAAGRLAEGTTKSARYVCVAQRRAP